MANISLHASQHLITANYKRLPRAIWCVFFLWAIPSNYTYIMSSSESLLHKGSPGGSFAIGQRREMAHIHLDQCRPGQANPPHQGLTSSGPALGLAYGAGSDCQGSRGRVITGQRTPRTPDRKNFNLQLQNNHRGGEGRQTNVDTEKDLCHCLCHPS